MHRLREGVHHRPSRRHIAWRQGSDLVVVDLQEPSQRTVAPSIVPDQEPGDAVVLPDIDGIALADDAVPDGVVAFSAVAGAGSIIADISAATTSGPHQRHGDSELTPVSNHLNATTFSDPALACASVASVSTSICCRRRMRPPQTSLAARQRSPSLWCRRGLPAVATSAGSRSPW